MLRIPVVATGVNFTDDSLGQNIYLGADLGNDYVVVSDMFTITNNNRPVLRTVSDDAGNWEFFLPGRAPDVLAVTYDPVSGLISTVGRRHQCVRGHTRLSIAAISSPAFSPTPMATACRTISSSPSARIPTSSTPMATARTTSPSSIAG